jgi:hypothetical protein
MTNGSLIESAVGVLSRGSAERFARRAFVSKVGRYGIAMTTGWAAMDLLKPENAFAHCVVSCGACGAGCCGQNSKFCAGNVCPSGTCGCGSWLESYSGCQSGLRRLADCCGGCGNCGVNCNAPNCPPSCCHHQQWTNGSCNDCATHVQCRRWFCA